MGVSAAKLAHGYQPGSNTYNCNALYLADLDLNYLPEPIFETYCDIQSLMCLSKSVTAMPKEIARLSRLSVLDMSHNSISAVPDELFSIVTLTKLRLGSNQISSLPIALGRLTNLTELHMSNNPLHSLPWSLFTITSLITLNLRATMLNIVPHHVSLLTNLTHLDIAANPINDVPLGITRLKKLSTLNVANCRMVQYISPLFSSLRNIRYFTLSGCSLRELPVWLADLPRLDMLSLEGNPCTGGTLLRLHPLRRKLHNTRTRQILEVLWMIALERMCYVRCLRGRGPPSHSDKIQLSPMSYFSRLPREILTAILSNICTGYCDLALQQADLLAAFDLFHKHAPALEHCPRLKICMWDNLCPKVDIPGEPGYREEYSFSSLRLRRIASGSFDGHQWRSRIDMLLVYVADKTERAVVSDPLQTHALELNDPSAVVIDFDPTPPSLLLASCPRTLRPGCACCTTCLELAGSSSPNCNHSGLA